MAKAYFGMALNSHSYEEAFENLDGAAAAQRHIARNPAHPQLPHLTRQLRIPRRQLRGGRKGDEGSRKPRDLEEPEEDDRRTGHGLPQAGQEIQGEKKKFEEKVAEGKEALENPLGGLGGSSSLSTTP